MHFQTGTDFFCLVAVGWRCVDSITKATAYTRIEYIYVCVGFLCSVIKRTNERLCGTLVIVRNFEKIETKTNEFYVKCYTNAGWQHNRRRKIYCARHSLYIISFCCFA